jgi:hypothetical protein
MSMATAALCRTEINLPASIADANFTAPISNAEDEIRRILRMLETLVVDYNHLEEDTNTFSEDGGTTFRFSYTQIGVLADGYDSAVDATYVTLLASINTALAANGQDALTVDDKYQLRQAGRDFRKAEILLALSQFAYFGGLRPTNEGGFVQDIAFGTGKTRLLPHDESIKVSKQFRHEALKQLFPWLKDPQSDIISDSIEYSDGSTEYFLPDSFTHPDLNISSVPVRMSRKDKDPRKRYAG